MRVFRTILALVIAASLALLPLGAPALAGPSGDAHSAMQMGGSNDMSMDDCCPDDMKGVPGHSGGEKCGMPVCCVSGTVALGDVAALRSRFLRTAATKVAIPVDQIVPVRDTSPPYRPPRV